MSAVRLGIVALPLLLWSGAASAMDVFGGYSALRLSGDNVSGASLAVSFPLRGAFWLDAEATGQLGLAGGEDLSEWTLLAGPRFTPWRDNRLSPFVHARAGAVRSRSQIEVFGIAIGDEGVCDGGCPSETSFAAELGGGLDFRLTRRLALRLPQVDYRLTGLAGDDSTRLRFSAGVVYRWGE